MTCALPPLSTRRRQMLQLLADGKSYAEIASILGISVNTVKATLRRLYARIGAANGTHAAAIAMRAGLVT
jgi:DNA-binding CsgD family transcriptional regulator